MKKHFIFIYQVNVSKAFGCFLTHELLCNAAYQPCGQVVGLINHLCRAS